MFFIERKKSIVVLIRAINLQEIFVREKFNIFNTEKFALIG